MLFDVPAWGLKRSLPYSWDLQRVSGLYGVRLRWATAYLNDMPYWATLSYPDFQTRVTSQAFVACSRHDRKAETALPPTVDGQYTTQLREEEMVLEASTAWSCACQRQSTCGCLLAYTHKSRGEPCAGLGDGDAPERMRNRGTAGAMSGPVSVVGSGGWLSRAGRRRRWRRRQRVEGPKSWRWGARW